MRQIQRNEMAGRSRFGKLSTSNAEWNMRLDMKAAILTALLFAPPVVLAQAKTPPQFNTVADKTPAAVDQLDQAMTLARRTLDFVQRSRPCPALASRLKQLEQHAATGEADRAELCQSVRQLRRPSFCRPSVQRVLRPCTIRVQNAI